MIGPLSFLVTVIFAPGLAGAATTPRWAILAIFVPWLLPTQYKLTAGHLMMLGFLLFAAVSLFWTSDPYNGTVEVFKIALMCGLFFIGAELKSLRPVYIWMALGVGVSSGLAIAQYLGWNGVDQYAPNAGLFFNPNFLAEMAVLVLVGLLVERLYWLTPLVLPAMFLPNARGPVLALVVAVAVWTRSRIVIGVLGFVVLIAGIYSYQTDYRLASVDERIAIWRDSIDGMTPLGHGAGSFYLQYPASATRTNTLFARPDHAHNDYLEAIYEYGPGAFLLFGAGFFAFRDGRHSRAVLVFLAASIICLVGFPLHNAATAFLIPLVAGHLCGHGLPVRSWLIGWREHLRGRNALRALRYAADRRGDVAV